MNAEEIVWLGLVVFFGAAACAQANDPLSNWATVVGWDYQVDANIVYKKASGIDYRLDVIYARDKSKARPTLIYLHGGGWRRRPYSLFWLGRV